MKTLQTSLRYSFSKRNAQRTTSIIIILGLAVAMCSILIIGSVVRALQSRQIEVLRAIESFDLILDTNLSKDQVYQIQGVSEVYEFAETTGIITDLNSGTNKATRFRAVDFDCYFSSPRVSKEIYFNLFSDKGLVVSNYNSVNNKNVKLTLLKEGKTASLVPYSLIAEVDGIHFSSEPTFSQTTSFIDINNYKEIYGNKGIKLGVFISSKQNKIINEIIKLDSEADITTWQEYNKATYSALLLEKVLIYLFMLFMFLILCINIKNSTSRLIFNKQKEGAILRALGCTTKELIRVFIFQGLILTILGEILGVLGSYLIIKFFPFDSILMGFLDIEFSYITALILFVFVFFLALLFIRRGCKKLYKKEIMEVLLNGTY